MISSVSCHISHAKLLYPRIPGRTGTQRKKTPPWRSERAKRRREGGARKGGRARNKDQADPSVWGRKTTARPPRFSTGTRSREAPALGAGAGSPAAWARCTCWAPCRLGGYWVPMVHSPICQTVEKSMYLFTCKNVDTLMPFSEEIVPYHRQLLALMSSL